MMYTINKLIVISISLCWLSLSVAKAQTAIYPTPEVESRNYQRVKMKEDTSIVNLRQELIKIDQIIGKIKKSNFNPYQLKSELDRSERMLRMIDIQVKDSAERVDKHTKVMKKIAIIRKKMDLVKKIPYLIKNRYDRLGEILQAFVKHPRSMEFHLDLKQIGILLSQDSTLRMFTWESNLAKDKLVYHNIVQTRLVDTTRNYFLHSRGLATISDAETMESNQWKGSIYYDLIESAKDNEYLLLGWRPSTNGKTQEKFVETMMVSDSGVVFGIPIISKEGKLRKRLVFEYSSTVNMSIKYEEQYKTIMIDHLNTYNEELEGMHEFYGPDFSYDALKLEDSVWVFYEDYNVDKVILEPKDELPF